MTQYQTIPIALNVTTNNRALVVGGGKIALQKIEWLQKFTMQIDVVAMEASDAVQMLASQGDIELELRPYYGLHHPYALVIAATGNESINRLVYQDATGLGIPVNVVDVPELCTFFVPSSISRGSLQLTISSNGNAPALCKRLRKEIEALVPPFYEKYALLLSRARAFAGSEVKDERIRAALLSYLASEPVARRFEQVSPEQQPHWFQHELQSHLASLTSGQPTIGTVYLVGAGPGDVALISLKGIRVLASADAVLYDGLVNPALLDCIGPNIERYDTSKRAGCAIRNQDDINQLMVSLAKAGKTVCRLKGGDPCVFGRVTSEARALAQHHIPFEIVPGITSAIAALAYAGIPVTDRDAASYFQVVTGHEAKDKTETRVNWQDIAQSSGTVVFLMGVHRLQEISEKLIQNGKSPQTPAAIISHGTLPTQTVFQTTLGDAVQPSFEIPDMPRPALIVVGDVVRLRDELRWFE